MILRRIVTLAIASILPMFCAPQAAADPVPDQFENVYGLLTPDEKQEIWTAGRTNCVALDRFVDANSKLTTQGVVDLITAYRNRGWDLESASDIAWESVEARCPEYLDVVKRAVRTLGDPS